MMIVTLFLLFPFVSCEQGGMSSKNANEKISISVPEVVFDSLNYDGGEVVEGAKVAHIFKFVNKGKKVLTISVRSTCGCTVAKLAKKEYAPGESGEVNVVFNSHGYSKNVTKRIIVTTNDPLKSKIYLTIKTFVKKYIEVSPGLINFQDVTYNSKKTVSVFFKGIVEKNFRITGIDIPAQMKESVSYKIKKMSNENSIYKVDFTLAPKNADIRSFGYSLIIHTDSKQLPNIPIQMRGTITGPIQYYPQAISSYTERERNFAYTVNFTSKDYFTIKKASFDFGKSDSYGIKVNTVKQGYIYTITVYSKYPVRAGIHGKLNVTTSIPVQNRVSLQLNIKVK